MSKGIRFKVWEGGDGFYAHLIAGNSRIVWVTESYLRSSSAFKACDSTWRQIAAAIDPSHVLQHPSVPYTRDSLLPVARRSH